MSRTHPPASHGRPAGDTLRPAPVSGSGRNGNGPATPGSRTGAALTDYQMRQLLGSCRTRVAVLIVLEVARLTRRYGNATPKRANMATRFGCCERTITRNVRALEDAGWLTVVRDPARRQSDGTYTRARTNLYRLHGPRKSCSHRRDTPVTSKPLRGCNSAAPRAVIPVYNPPSLFATHDPPPDTVPPPWRNDPDWLERQRRGDG